MLRDLLTEMTIAIPPKFAGSESLGIKDYLNHLILKYVFIVAHRRHVPSLHGVVLSYDSIKALESTGRLMYDSPYCHLKVRAQLTVFAPKIGMLVGTDLYFVFDSIRGSGQQGFS